MSCGTSTALTTTTGLILKFVLRALCGEDRPFKMGGPTPPSGLSASFTLSLSTIQEELWRSSIGQELLSAKLQQAGCGPIRFSHEAVTHVVRIEVESGHRPVGSNAVGVHTLEGACAGARHFELN